MGSQEPQTSATEASGQGPEVAQQSEEVIIEHAFRRVLEVYKGDSLQEVLARITRLLDEVGIRNAWEKTNTYTLRLLQKIDFGPTLGSFIIARSKANADSPTDSGS